MTLDREFAFACLKGLLPSQFDELVFRLGVPREHLSASPAPLSTRSIELIYWVSQEPARIERFHGVLADLRSHVSPRERETSSPPRSVVPSLPRGWTLDEVLHEGDASCVLAARDDSGHEVVLKCYRPGADPALEVARRARFLRGLSALRVLARKGAHPNLVALHTAPPDASAELWYALRRIHGPSLAQGIGHILTLPVLQRLRLYQGLCEGIAFAQRPGLPGRVFHRNLTPADILVDLAAEAPRLVIADFDLARDDTTRSLTFAQGLFGRLSYLPPEQAEAWDGGPRWERPDEELRDLWALGMVLHFMLTGSHSLSPAMRRARRASKLKSEPDALRTRIDGLVEWCLAERPEDRPQGADDLTLAVAAIVAEFDERRGDCVL